jgi:hypothetical protein
MVGKGTRLHPGWATDSPAEANAARTPGKRTLTDDLAMPYQASNAGRAPPPSALQAEPPRSTLPRLDLAPGKASAAAAGGSTHAAPPKRVADANAKEPNAVIKVVAYAKGKLLGKPWGAKGRWEGPLPRKYTGTRGPTGWTWDDPDAKTVRIGSDLQGRGGRTVEAWAGAHADRIIVYATALDAVTNDEEAQQDEHAPGHATGKQGAGDGPPPSVKPADQRPGAGETARDRNHGDGGTPGGTGGAGGVGDHEQPSHGDAAQGDAIGPSDADEKLADDFERELGLAPIGEDGEASEASEDGAPGSAGSTGRATSPVRGRAGEDTRLGGTGPGGERARSDGDGKGSDDGGRGGSEAGSRDGAEDGDPDGMYGGEGKSGDGGIPSAVALFGGLLSVPPALRGLVELALIISSGNVTGAGSQLFKRGLGKLTSAAAARTMIAHEARAVAVRETQLALKRIAADERTAKAWAKATAAEKLQATRIIYWELQRKYFQGYLAAARRAKSEAKAALRKTPASSSAQQRLKQAELAEEAAAAPPIAGQLPRNHEFAGKQFPSDRLPPAYRQQGVRFSEAGYPDFSPYAQTLPNGQKSVQITYTGSRSGDFVAANAKAGYKQMPEGFTWHHHEDMKTMLLIPERLHDTVKHTGGVATYKHTSGAAGYGN